ncbi:MAG: helix-turn-helix domain-containing protein [Rhizobiales bacterium]|nr:helix-turn-helix domain-containing protein [Hyphomicrobiales bacterium]
MPETRLDRDQYVIGDPSAHVGFLNCERISERSHIHDWSVDTHYHEGLSQLFVFNSGHVKGQIDYTLHDISGPAMIWLPALCSHAFEYQVGMEGWVITVPTADISRITSTATWLARWVSKPQILLGAEHQLRNSEAVEIAQKIEIEHRELGAESNLALESLFLLLLISLNRGLVLKDAEKSGITDRKRQLVNQFQALLEKNQTAAQSVSDYAAMLSVTSTHLTRTVKSVTGRTAGQIISDRILLAAKRKLAFTDQSITEIGYDLEFSSPSYFTRFFSTHTGQTPRAFRKTVKTIMCT